MFTDEQKKNDFRMFLTVNGTLNKEKIPGRLTYAFLAKWEADF